MDLLEKVLWEPTLQMSEGLNRVIRADTVIFSCTVQLELMSVSISFQALEMFMFQTRIHKF